MISVDDPQRSSHADCDAVLYCVARASYTGDLLGQPKTVDAEINALIQLPSDRRAGPAGKWEGRGNDLGLAAVGENQINDERTCQSGVQGEE